MNNLMVFENQNFGIVKTICKDGEPIFLANPLSAILGYSKTNGMLRRLDDDEKIEISSKEVGEILGCTLNELGVSKYAPSIMFITESGLYNAILGSDKKEAKQFKRWVTSEVLPQIRRTGSYQSQQKLINGLNETIEQMQGTITEYKSMCKITCSKKRNYSDYIKKALGINKANGEFERVKARIFLVLGVNKWEDIDFETSKNLLSVIDESIRVAKSERPYKQMSYFD